MCIEKQCDKSPEFYLYSNEKPVLLCEEHIATHSCTEGVIARPILISPITPDDKKAILSCISVLRSAHTSMTDKLLQDKENKI